jgi:AraC-like DNA-binding protein
MSQRPAPDPRLLDAYRADLPAPDPAWPPDVRAAVRHIHAHLFDGLRVADVRRACRIHRADFSGRFALFVGTTPKAYILMHQIEASKRLLARSECTILAVALAVGFASHSAFTNAFRRYEGQPPSTFREQERGGL